MDSISVEIRKTQPLDLILQDVGSLYCDEICESIEKKEISSAALVPDESLDSLFYDANEDIESSFRDDHVVALDPTYEEGDLEMAEIQGAVVAADINDDEELVAEFRTNMKGKNG
ncbi:forkhead-associated domain-containing family protein [Salix suchowensis]|nr:forkhead-associated domain-containing family protein [Salix suchowensis]